MSDKPKIQSSSQKELDKAAENFAQFDQSVKDMTLDRMNEAKPVEQEPQTKMSSREIHAAPEIRLKAKRFTRSIEKFNENFRNDYNYAKEYVQFIAEHYELIGANIECWTKAFPGQDAEYWEVPTNKPVWGPRYLAEQLRKCNYHVFSMDERVATGAQDQYGSYTGKIVVDSVKSRLNANPVSSSKSIFMGASGF